MGFWGVGAGSEAAKKSVYIKSGFLSWLRFEDCIILKIERLSQTSRRIQ